MQCELCGADFPSCKPALVDGVKMMLCPNCMRHGERIKEVVSSPSPGETPLVQRIRKPKVKDVYEKMNKELVANWHVLIKQAREKKGLSREELGFKIGERTVTIAKIENGDLRPADKIIEKLEKELGISLFEEVTRVPAGVTRAGSSGYTLGDFLKGKTEK